MVVSARSVEVLWIGRVLGAETRGEEDGVKTAEGFWDFGSGQNMIRDSELDLFRSRTLRAQRAREMPCGGQEPEYGFGDQEENRPEPKRR
jgi:hypothetical protein